MAEAYYLHATEQLKLIMVKLATQNIMARSTGSATIG